MNLKITFSLILIFTSQFSFASPKKIRVFIALCDNKTQGIVPVGKKIGNGNDAASNLYWGCSDGFGSYFRRSKSWKIISSETDVSRLILRRMKLSHKSNDMEIVAEAYRGSRNIKQCLTDFESAASQGNYDLVAFIGHNGLMDFPLPNPKPVRLTEKIKTSNLLV